MVENAEKSANAGDNDLAADKDMVRDSISSLSVKDANESSVDASNRVSQYLAILVRIRN